MKIILSGEDTSKLFGREMALLRTAREEGKTVRSLDASKQKEPELLEALGIQGMFTASQVWHLKGWEKLRSPKLQTNLLELLESTADDVILTIPTEPSAAQKKKLPGTWKHERFPLPAAVFSFLESLKVKPYNQVHTLLQQSLGAGSEWGLHFLLSRQLRYLLQAKVGAPIAGPPFLANKIRSQSRHFSQEELLMALDFLFQLEADFKQGKKKIAWSASIDILLGRLYYDAH